MNDPMIVFGAPLIEDDEIEAVTSVLKSGWLGTGKRVAEFESVFAHFKGVEPGRTAAVNSCTAALQLGLVALGVGPGDEVITTALTFCATVNAIVNVGALPVLADVDPQTMNIDPRCISEKIGSRTKAVVPVHFAGRPCEMAEIMRIADAHGLFIVEDCAHAIESELSGRSTGTFGDVGCFSFYATKNITTGEGGMVVTRREETADYIRVLALHGMSKDAWHRFGSQGYRHYDVIASGYKHNMTDVQAALGISQMTKIHRFRAMREHQWSRYRDELSDLPVSLPGNVSADQKHAYHLFTVLVDKGISGVSRDELLAELTKQRIGVGVHYRSIPEFRYYQERFGWRPEDFPNAYDIGRTTISLPLSPRIGDGEIDRVVRALRRALNA